MQTKLSFCSEKLISVHDLNCYTKKQIYTASVSLHKHPVYLLHSRWKRIIARKRMTKLYEP